jgi:hypothetical protein
VAFATQDVGHVKVRAGSAAIGLVIEETAGRAAPGVTGMPASGGRAAMMIARAGAAETATDPMKGVSRAPLANGRSGASAANESGTPGVRGAKTRDGFSAHRRLDRGHRRSDVQRQE